MIRLAALTNELSTHLHIGRVLGLHRYVSQGMNVGRDGDMRLILAAK